MVYEGRVVLLWDLPPEVVSVNVGISRQRS